MEKAGALAALSGLAHETRLDIYRLLVETGDEGLHVGAIAERLSLASATLSFHLSQLRHAGLIGCRREGRSLIYSARYDVMTSLLDYLTKNCCGDPALCGLDPPDVPTDHRDPASLREAR